MEVDEIEQSAKWNLTVVVVNDANVLPLVVVHPQGISSVSECPSVCGWVMLACVPRLARPGFSDEENDTRFLTFCKIPSGFECVFQFVHKLGVARESGCPHVVE